jgi:hypothetical protein
MTSQLAVKNIRGYGGFAVALKIKSRSKSKSKAKQIPLKCFDQPFGC